MAKDPRQSAWLQQDKLFQNYKQLQFADTLALYFNRIHPNDRAPQAFEHVPLNAKQDTTVAIEPRESGVYAVSPYPFAANGAEFAFASRRIRPHEHAATRSWLEVRKTRRGLR